MPTTDAFIIGAIVVVFIVFGAVLAWADYQTSTARRSARQSVGGGEKRYEPTGPIPANPARIKELIAP